MGWVDWEMTDLDGGYMYCCSLEDAASALEEIASLNLQESSGLIQVAGSPPSTTTEGPTSAPAACTVNLDQLTGKYPPMLTRNSQFIYPTSEEADATRLLGFDENDLLDLYCHGSLRYQATTTVETSDGVDTGASKLSLQCKNNQFVTVQDSVSLTKLKIHFKM